MPDLHPTAGRPRAGWYSDGPCVIRACCEVLSASSLPKGCTLQGLCMVVFVADNEASHHAVSLARSLVRPARDSVHIATSVAADAGFAEAQRLLTRHTEQFELSTRLETDVLVWMCTCLYTVTSCASFLASVCKGGGELGFAQGVFLIVPNVCCRAGLCNAHRQCALFARFPFHLCHICATQCWQRLRSRKQCTQHA